MCGIAGIITKNNNIEKAELIKYAEFMQERGPENTGYYLKNNVGLTHTRLSIIDLSVDANQPMVRENIAITFNGEIYNYEKIKSELPNFKFSTNSDTEVIIAAYKEFGIDLLLQKLDGMFAFCIVDFNKNIAFLCRDIFGKKPLYFYYSNNEFIFSSDIKAIQFDKKQNLTLNYNALDYYLTELSVPQPLTIWNEINQVNQSHFVQIDLNNLLINQKKYWSFNYTNKIKITEQEAINEVENKLKQAVLKRTKSDVPFAVFLSGGIDSGLITSILAKYSNEKINTYTIGFNYDDFNEFELAKKVSKKYNTNHIEIKSKFDIHDFIHDLTNYVGEPFADSSIIPTYIVTKEFSKKVKMAISGDGGDEVFGGYYEYNTAIMSDNYFNNKSEIENKIKTIYSKINSRINKKTENLGNYYDFYKSNGYKKLYRQMGFSASDKKLLYKDNQKNFTIRYLNDIWDNNFVDTQTDCLFASSFQTRLLNDYLVKLDRASMFNSIEVRSPFLDKDLVQFSLSIPNKIKLKNGINKYILKKIVEKNYDKDIFNRKKQGFGLPIKYWINNELSDLLRYYLSKERIEKRNLFNYKYVNRLLQDHYKYQNNTHRLWALLILEIWFEKFVD